MKKMLFLFFVALMSFVVLSQNVFASDDSLVYLETQTYYQNYLDEYGNLVRKEISGKEANQRIKIKKQVKELLKLNEDFKKENKKRKDLK